MAKPPAPGGRKSKMPFDEERGKRLKAFLGDWEIEEFARQTGIGKTSLYGYMRGEPISGRNLAKICDELHLTRDEIVKGSQAEATEADDRTTADLLRELVAGQQELTAVALRVERLLKAQREPGQHDVRRRSAGG